MSFIGKGWRGEERLWKVFWLYGFVYPIAVNILVKLLAHFLPFLNILYGICLIPFTIWWIVATWRCAFNVNNRSWGYAARFFGCGGFIIIGLIVGGVLAGQDLIRAAKCQKILKEEAAQHGVDFNQYKASISPAEFAEKCHFNMPVQNSSTTPEVKVAAVSASSMPDYGATLSGWVMQSIRYPMAANNAEGKVILRIRIDRAGHVRYLKVEQSSGSTTLDAAAMDAVAHAGVAPSVPANYPPGDLLDFLIPIVFKAPSKNP